MRETLEYEAPKSLVETRTWFFVPQFKLRKERGYWMKVP